MSEIIEAAPAGRPNAQMRATFYRLYEDIIEQLNVGVKIRTVAGVRQRAIAEQADQDPGFLSRILSGNGGTNLRSIAAVLYAVQGRFEIKFIPLENDGSVDHWVRIGRSVSLQCRDAEWTPVFDYDPEPEHTKLQRNLQPMTFAALEG